MRLMLGDCLELMAEVEGRSVDLILADLPYGTTACKWDTIIPLVPLWEQYRRILKPRGCVVLTASQPFTSMLVSSNPGWFKHTLVWEKNRLTNFFNVKYQPGKTHEDIAVFSAAPASYSSNPTMTFNPQMLPGEPWAKTNTSIGRHTFHAKAKPQFRSRAGGRYPGSVLRFDCEHGLHHTQKPVPLFEYLVRTYSNPGELVMDNAMGSGTTGVACINTGRRFIGIERDPEYFSVAEARIRSTQGQA